VYVPKALSMNTYHSMNYTLSQIISNTVTVGLTFTNTVHLIFNTLYQKLLMQILNLITCKTITHLISSMIQAIK